MTSDYPSLRSALEQRLAAREESSQSVPHDRYSHEWYRQQLAGICHLQRILSSEQADQGELVKIMGNLLERLEQTTSEDAVAIGELREQVHGLDVRLSAIEDKLDKVVSWLKSRNKPTDKNGVDS